MTFAASAAVAGLSLARAVITTELRGGFCSASSIALIGGDRISEPNTLRGVALAALVLELGWRST